MKRRTILFLWLAIPILTVYSSCTHRPPIEVTGTRFENKFQIEEGRGLVVSVRINQLQDKPTSNDFRLVFTDSNGRPGELPALAMGIPDATDPSQRWVLLVDQTGLSGRTGNIEKEGRYEFVYMIGPSVKEASLRYRQERVGSFTVPW